MNYDATKMVLVQESNSAHDESVEGSGLPMVRHLWPRHLPLHTSFTKRETCGCGTKDDATNHMRPRWRWPRD